MNSTVKRSITGLVFLAIVLCALLLNRYLFAALLLFILVVMLHEFFTMTMGKRFMVPRSMAYLTAVCLFVVTFLICSSQISVKWLALPLVPLIVMTCSSIHCMPKENFTEFAFLYAALVYIALPLAGSNLVVFNDGEFSGIQMISFLILIWASDIGAYVFGLGFGQKPGSKKLCPEISPKKSWAGVWGGLFTAIIAGVILSLTGMLDYSLVHCIILAIIMTIAGIYGDLFESQWKRYFDLKDSGNIMPGHGGLLDRFDSAILAIPAGALYLLLISSL